MKRTLLIVLCLLLAAGAVFAGGKQEKGGSTEKPAASEEAAKPEEKTVKAGFVYIGPAGDFGWTYAHEQGRLYAMEQLPWLESVTVESVPEGDAVRFIDRLIQEQKCEIIFTTSFGYLDDTVKAAERYPDTTFMHCSGYKRDDNLGVYMADLYQPYYMNGLMAGAMTKSNKIGYVAAFPIPELFRHMNAFALGIKEVNPDAKVYAKWIYAWYGPDKAREAAEALISEGCDTLAFTEDTPAVIEVGQEHTEKGKQIYTFSHYSPMQQYGEDTVLSGQLVDWGIMYEATLKDYYNGTWDSPDMLYLMKQGGAYLGGLHGEKFNDKFVPELKNIMVDSEDFGEISVYDLVLKRHDQMMQGREVFDPFTGPIYDTRGNMTIAEGEIATIPHLFAEMNYFVDNFATEPPQD